MPKLACRILVINDEQLVLREFVKGLNAAARALDNPLGISFTGVTTAKEALALIESDGDLQAVLVDDTLYSLARGNGKENGQKQLQMSALELVQRITASGRPEEVKAKVREYVANGCTCPILYPLGDPYLMIEVFSDGYSE